MRKSVASVCFCVLASIAYLSAQAPAENLARVYRVSVKTGMEVSFEQALRAHAKWRSEQGDPWTWIVYQVVNGDNLGDYYIRSGNHTWADFDAYDSFLIKGTPHFNAVVGPYMNSITSAITSLDTEHMIWPEDPTSVTLLQLIVYRLKIGSEAQFGQAVAQVHDAIVKTNWPAHYAWETLVNGGEASAATLVLPSRNWEGMKQPEKSLDAMLAEALGADGAQALLAKFAASVASERSLVVRVRLDLSVMAH